MKEMQIYNNNCIRTVSICMYVQHHDDLVRVATCYFTGHEDSHFFSIFVLECSFNGNNSLYTQRDVMCPY